MFDASIEPTKRRPNTSCAGVPAKANRSAQGIAAAGTLRSWLGMWSLRVAQTRAEPQLAGDQQARSGDQCRGRTPECFPLIAATHCHRARRQPHPADLGGHRSLLHHPGGNCSEQVDIITKWIAKRWR